MLGPIAETHGVGLSGATLFLSVSLCGNVPRPRMTTGSGEPTQPDLFEFAVLKMADELDSSSLPSTAAHALGCIHVCEAVMLRSKQSNSKSLGCWSEANLLR